MTEQSNPYAEAALVACPKCGAKMGEPCRERYCKNGYRNCRYAVCSRIRDLDHPHPARLARAAVTPAPAVGDARAGSEPRS